MSSKAKDHLLQGSASRLELPGYLVSMAPGSLRPEAGTRTADDADGERERPVQKSSDDTSIDYKILKEVDIKKRLALS